MDSYALVLILKTVRDLAKQDESILLSRHFRLSQQDRQWLAESSETELLAISRIPASPFELVIEQASSASKSGSPISQMHDSNPTVMTLTNVIGSIAESCRNDALCARVSWGMTEASTRWLVNSSLGERVEAIASGRCHFKPRTSFKKLKVEADDRTSVMSGLMRILSNPRIAQIGDRI